MYKSNNLRRGDLDPRDKSRFALGPPISEGFCSVISYHDAKDWEHSWGWRWGCGWDHYVPPITEKCDAI